MAGYDYYEWKSNNAVQAEWEGKHPMSHWTKDLLIESIENEFRSKPEIVELCKKQPLAVLRKAMLCYSEWHHTSSAYNETYYYELVGGSIEDIKGYIKTTTTEESGTIYNLDYEKVSEDFGIEEPIFKRHDKLIRQLGRTLIPSRSDKLCRFFVIIIHYSVFDRK